MTCPCGKWLSSSARDRYFCTDHSLHRTHRVNRTLFNRAGHIPALSEFPYHFRTKYAGLFATYTDVDCTGCRIFCLSLRPNVASVRAFSRNLCSTGGRRARTHFIAWCLFAERMYDPACIRAVLQPLLIEEIQKPLLDFDLLALKEFRRRLRAYNAHASEVVYGTKKRYKEFEAKQCNPTGVASGHSGHKFLHDIIHQRGALDDFVSLCTDIADVLFSGHDHRVAYDCDDLTEALNGIPILHTSVYYKMAMYRTAKHCIQVSTSKRGPTWPPCEYSEELWDMLLEYDGGSQKGAELFGITSFKDAMAFCEGMRKQIPSYCLCDLSCWLCLASACKSTRTLKRKR